MNTRERRASKEMMVLKLLWLWIGLLGGDAWAEPDRVARLDAGEVLVSSVEVKGADIPRAVVEAVVEAPPEAVWAVVSDCNRYPQTMPNTKEAKELSRAGNKVICRMVTEMPFPLPDFVVKTEAVHRVKPPHYRRTWTLIGGDLERNDGLWDIRPFKGKSGRSLVRYEILAVPKMAVPATLQAFAQRRTLPGLMARLRDEVKKWQGRAKGPAGQPN